MKLNRQILSKHMVILATSTILSGCAVTEVAVNLAKTGNTEQTEEKDITNTNSEANETELNSSSQVKNNNITKDNSNASDSLVLPEIKKEPKVVANPQYKIGEPYEVFGKWYYPERDLRYDKTGIASWYGDEWAGKLTANGEIFEPSLVSAAHKTLPMPSVVRVTNLENGKSLVVRLNDRGPFVAGRIIDLSTEAARRLGFLKKGIAKVRVQILAEQSLALEREAKKNKFPLLLSNEEMPPIIADNVPQVNLDAITTRKIKSLPKNRTSAIELLAQSRIGEVIEIPVTETKIWVQIGAFYNKESALSVLDKYEKMIGSVSENLHNGKPIYRARLGPIKSVEDADIILADVLAFGFEGAHIIVD